MFEEGEGKIGATADAPGGFGDLIGEGGEIVWGEVGELCCVEIRPKILDRVEFGGVGGEELHLEPVLLGSEMSLGGCAPMRGEVIPEKHCLALYMPAQVAEELDHLGGLDASLLEAQEKARLAGGWFEPQGGDGGKMSPPEALSKDRSLAPRRPGAAKRGTEGKPALIEANDQRSLLLGPLFMRGQSSLTQRAMAASSLSLARLCGFWQLHPILRRMYHTWPG